MRTRRVLLAPALALAVSLPALALAQAGGNPVLNPGAEEAAEETDPGVSQPPPYWTATGGFTIVAYGQPGFPDGAASAAIEGGARFFAGGPAELPGLGTSTAAQYVDISQNAPAIVAGQVRIELEAALGGAGQDADVGTIAAQFADDQGALLRDEQNRPRQVVIGPVTAADRGNQTRLVTRAASAEVPPEARSVRILMRAESREGDYIDAYFDNVVVRFPGATEPVTGVPNGAPGGGPAPGAGAGGGGEPARFRSRAARMSKSGVMRVRASCLRDEACNGRLVAAIGRRGCGAARVRLPARRTRTLALKLGKACRREVARRAKGARVTLELRLADGPVVRTKIPVRRA